MWFLLGLMIAAAALLSHVRTSRWQSALQQAAVFGSIEVRLPKGWQVAPEDRGDTIQITAREPGGKKTLTITATSARVEFDAMEYFMRTQALALAINERELVQYDEEVEVPGGKGAIFHLMDSRENPIASVAHVSFESGIAVVVDLRDAARRTPDDEALLMEVTRSLRAHAEPARTPKATTDSVVL